MEFLNKIELCGIIGNTTIRQFQGGDVIRFSLVVEEAYKGTDGINIVDTTWFNCTAWKGENIPDLTMIEKGKAVKVTGRVKIQKLLSPSENESYVWEVICKSIEVLD